METAALLSVRTVLIVISWLLLILMGLWQGIKRDIKKKIPRANEWLEQHKEVIRLAHKWAFIFIGITILLSGFLPAIYEGIAY